MAKVFVELRGGLGNQMFQYAAALAFCKKHNLSLEIDNSFLKENTLESATFTPREFELNCFQGLKMIFKNPSDDNKISKLITEDNINSSFIFSRLLRGNILVSGYFQSETFFSAISKTISQIFSIKEELLTNEILTQVATLQDVESVGIHVRRGDYLKPEVLKYHGVCSAEYYQKAIRLMNSTLNSPKYFIFSEDMDWVKQELLPIISEAVLIESDSNKPSWLDLLYLSKCKNNIIANSSYSWWGAYLNDNSSKSVIAPKIWFKDDILNQKTIDLIPKSWIRI